MMSKRVVIVTSDKGGSGKTMWARGYADWLRRQTMSAFLSDADGEVGQLLQFYGQKDASGARLAAQNGRIGVHFWDAKVPRQRDGFLDGIEDDADRVVIDMPGGSLGLVDEINREIGIFDTIRRAGYALTFVNVITPMRASVRTVTRMLDLFCNEPTATFVVAKNRFFGPEPDDWQIWDSSKARMALGDIGGRVVDLPMMRMRTVALIDDLSLRFCDAVAHPQVRIADRSVVMRWAKDVDDSIKSLEGIL